MKKRTKIAIIACAAVLLAAGGVGVWQYRQNIGITELPVPVEIDDTGTLGLRLTSQQDDTAAFGLTGDQFYPGWPAVSENGSYFTEEVSRLRTEDNSWYRHQMLCFASHATTEVIPLCPQPQCLHDGSQYCTATTEVYESQHVICGEGDVLYALAIKHSDRNSYENDTRKYVLLRYEPGGTAITELYDYKQEEYHRNSMMPRLTMHRGWLWAAIPRLIRDGGVMNPMGDMRYTYNGGFEIVGYELATGKTVSLFSDSVGNDLASDDVCFTPYTLVGVGDYLYFSIQDFSDLNNTLPPKLKKRGLWRISLLTGEPEYVTNKPIERICGKYGLYDDYTPDDMNQKGIWAYDLQTNETHYICEGLASFDKACDGQYLVVPGTENKHSIFRILDLNGKELNRVTWPDDQCYGYGFISGGRYYVMTQGHITDTGWSATRDDPQEMRSITLEDMLAGNSRWALEYDMLAVYKKYDHDWQNAN